MSTEVGWRPLHSTDRLGSEKWNEVIAQPNKSGGPREKKAVRVKFDGQQRSASRAYVVTLTSYSLTGRNTVPREKTHSTDSVLLRFKLRNKGTRRRLKNRRRDV
jgi:hypothetical protein